MFHTKVVEKFKTHILYSIRVFWKFCCLWNNVEKYSRAEQATDDNIIRRMRFACWITKATDTHSQYVILIAFPRQQWLNNNVTLYVHCPSYLTLNLMVYKVITGPFFPNSSTAPWGPRPPHFSTLHDHTLDTPHSVGLLWTRDQPIAETSTWQHTTLTRDRHPCHRRDSNPQFQ
jgi:hypothetical protein